MENLATLSIMASHACTENAVKAQAFAKDELSNRRSGVNGGDFAIVEMQFQSNHRAFRHAKQFTLYDALLVV